MIIGLATLSILFGGACGIAAFCAEFGAMQSLMIYAVVGLMPFLLMPLIGSPQPVRADICGDDMRAPGAGVPRLHGKRDI